MRSERFGKVSGVAVLQNKQTNKQATLLLGGGCRSPLMQLDWIGAIWLNSKTVRVISQMIIITFITLNSSLVPLIKGLGFMLLKSLWIRVVGVKFTSVAFLCWKEKCVPGKTKLGQDFIPPHSTYI